MYTHDDTRSRDFLLVVWSSGRLVPFAQRPGIYLTGNDSKHRLCFSPRSMVSRFAVAYAKGDRLRNRKGTRKARDRGEKEAIGVGEAKGRGQLDGRRGEVQVEDEPVFSEAEGIGYSVNNATRPADARRREATRRPYLGYRCHRIQFLYHLGHRTVLRFYRFQALLPREKSFGFARSRCIGANGAGEPANGSRQVRGWFVTLQPRINQTCAKELVTLAHALAHHPRAFLAFVNFPPRTIPS